MLQRHMSVVAVAGLVLAFAGLTGCGQKGPLTLPKPLPAASAPVAAK